MCRWGHHSSHQRWLKGAFVVQKKNTANSNKPVHTWITSVLHCLQEKLLKMWRTAEKNNRNSVWISPNASSRSSCVLHICGQSWVVCCGMGCVFLCFLWVCVCVSAYARLCICSHCTQARLVEALGGCRATPPVAAVTTVWPSALSW